MAERCDLLIRGGTCVSHRGTTEADVGIRDGRIVDVGDLGTVVAANVIDARGLHVLPGVIDSHVHMRETGMEHKEDLESGTRAAVLGGITAVFDMPNTEPPTVDEASMRDKVASATGRACCDFAFLLGITAANAGQLDELERLPGCAALKLFMGKSTGGLLVAEDEILRRALGSGTRRVAVHAEDERRLQERRERLAEDAWVGMHPVWRDDLTALHATQRVLGIARVAGRRIHILHVTTAKEMDLLAEHRDLATVECTPQHLTLAAPACYDDLGTLAQMNPPIRGEAHREALWAAVRAGIVDVVGSDHAPHTQEEKRRSYPGSPSGMPGVQTLLPIMLDHVHAGRLSIEQLVDLVCAGPVRVYGVAGKGRLAAGYDADLTLVDLGARRTIENDWIASRCGWTPYDGKAVRGWPIATVVRGNVVMRDGEIQEAAVGRLVSFVETLEAGAG
jgi:dihydroorotase